MKTFGTVVFYTITIVIGALWAGYVLSILWGWFIVSQFPSVPHLSVAAAIGVTLVVRMICESNNTDTPRDEADRKARIGLGIAQTFARPTFALLCGWIIRGFL